MQLIRILVHKNAFIKAQIWLCTFLDCNILQFVKWCKKHHQVWRCFQPIHWWNKLRCCIWVVGRVCTQYTCNTCLPLCMVLEAMASEKEDSSSSRICQIWVWPLMPPFLQITSSLQRDEGLARKVSFFLYSAYSAFYKLLEIYYCSAEL